MTQSHHHPVTTFMPVHLGITVDQGEDGNTKLEMLQLRVSCLEKLTTEKLCQLGMWKVGGDPPSKLSTSPKLLNEEVTSYLREVNHQLNLPFRRSTTTTMSKKRSKPGSSQCEDKDQDHCAQLIARFNQRLTDLVSTPHRHYNPSNPKSSVWPSTKMGPILVGDFRLGLILQQVIEVYCVRLDPSGFWLSRGEVETVIRRPGPSLLKRLILDAALRMSSLNSQERSMIITADRRSLAWEVAQTYHQPTLDDVLGLGLLACKYLIKVDLDRAKLYLGKAFRMADMLGVHPNCRGGLFSGSNPALDDRKDRIWETLLFYHGLVFFMAPGPPLFRCDAPLRLGHILHRPNSIPTAIRVFKRGNVNQFLHTERRRMFRSSPRYLQDSEETQPFEIELTPAPTPKLPPTNLQCQLRSFGHLMRIYQHSLVLQAAHFFTKAPPDATTAYMHQPERDAMARDIKDVLAIMPVNYTVPKVMSQAYSYQMVVGRLTEDSVAYVGQFSYSYLQLIRIYLVYPLVWFDPQPLPLARPEDWQEVLQACNALYGFYSALLCDVIQRGNSGVVQAVKATDVPVAIYAYLNAVLNHPSADTTTRFQFFVKAHGLINQLVAVSKATHISCHKDAKQAVRNLLKFLPRYPLPPQYKLDLI